MNKPASLVFIAFFVLGGLMWFAASNSFEQYLNHYQITINEQLPKGSKFSVSDVQLSPSEPMGEISQASLTIPFQGQDIGLTINSLVWQYEKRSLKKAEVNVEWMTVDTLNLMLPRGNVREANTLMVETIDELAQRANSQQQGVNGNQEFQVKVNKLIIKTLIVTLSENNQPIEEIIFSNLQLPTEQLSKAKMMSITGTEILTSLIEAAQAKLDDESATTSEQAKMN